MGLLDTLKNVVRNEAKFEDKKLKTHIMDLLTQLDLDVSGEGYDPPEESMLAFEALDKYVKERDESAADQADISQVAEENKIESVETVEIEDELEPVEKEEEELEDEDFEDTEEIDKDELEDEDEDEVK